MPAMQMAFTFPYFFTIPLWGVGLTEGSVWHLNDLVVDLGGGLKMCERMPIGAQVEGRTAKLAVCQQLSHLV